MAEQMESVDRYKYLIIRNIGQHFALHCTRIEKSINLSIIDFIDIFNLQRFVRFLIPNTSNPLPVSL